MKGKVLKCLEDNIEYVYDFKVEKIFLVKIEDIMEELWRKRLINVIILKLGNFLWNDIIKRMKI